MSSTPDHLNVCDHWYLALGPGQAGSLPARWVPREGSGAGVYNAALADEAGKAKAVEVALLIG